MKNKPGFIIRAELGYRVHEEIRLGMTYTHERPFINNLVPFQSDRFQKKGEKTNEVVKRTSQGLF